MNTADELTGRLVLVHPTVNDPFECAGKVGEITSIDLDNDTISVNFGKNAQGLYASDALLLLKSPESIKEICDSALHTPSADENKAIFNILLLQEFRQSAANIKAAMSLALTSDMVRLHTMESLEEVLQRRQGQSLER